MFLNALLLFGLVGVAIPPLLHFLNRRKLRVIDWPAMQYLKFSPKTRRSVFFESFWLMFLRCMAIVCLVLALAAPQVTSRLFGTTGQAGRRIIFLIDHSASMKTDRGKNRAVPWVQEALAQLDPGDAVAIYAVQAQPTEVVPPWSTEHNQSQVTLDFMTKPAGNADWPAALRFALAELSQNTTQGEIICVRDEQRFGWGDESTLPRWEFVQQAQTDIPLSVVVSLATVGGANSDGSAFQLEPVQLDGGLNGAGREVTLQVKVQTQSREAGRATAPEVEVLIDQGTLLNAHVTQRGEQQWQASVKHRFAAGSHGIIFRLKNSDQAELTQQSYALELPEKIPVLIIDGATEHTATAGQFLRDALAPERDTEASFVVRVVSAAEWSSTLLDADVAEAQTTPQIVVLSSVPKLTAMQCTALEQFLNRGGSVLVLLGQRTDASNWNRMAFRSGQGFLPGRILSATPPVPTALAPRFEIAGSLHPALKLFETPLPGGLQTAVFPSVWQVDLAATNGGRTGAVMAHLTDQQPLLVERSYGRGRVVLALHPLDAHDGSNLVRLPDYVRLTHELLAYLAAVRVADCNLLPGQAFAWAPRGSEPMGTAQLLQPDNKAVTVPITSWPVVLDCLTEAGLYQLRLPSGRVVHFSVQNDTREANLASLTEADHATVAAQMGGYERITSLPTAPADTVQLPISREVWWLLIVGVLVVLVLERAWLLQLHRLRQAVDSRGGTLR